MRKRNIWVSICRIEWLTVINLQSGINIFYLYLVLKWKQSIYGKAKHRLYLNRTCHISIYTHFQINIQKKNNWKTHSLWPCFCFLARLILYWVWLSSGLYFRICWHVYWVRLPWEEKQVFWNMNKCGNEHLPSPLRDFIKAKYS